jgi:hypothetical protein
VVLVNFLILQVVRYRKYDVGCGVETNIDHGLNDDGVNRVVLVCSLQQRMRQSTH